MFQFSAVKIIGELFRYAYNSCAQVTQAASRRTDIFVSFVVCVA